MVGKEYTKTRGVRSNFALVGQKGVGPGRRKWEDLRPPQSLDLNARSLLSYSSGMKRWQKAEQAHCNAIRIPLCANIYQHNQCKVDLYLALNPKTWMYM